jgi:hypothetical protein
MNYTIKYTNNCNYYNNNEIKLTMMQSRDKSKYTYKLRLVYGVAW